MPLLVKHPPGIPIQCGCGQTINDGKAVCGAFGGVPCNGDQRLPPKGFNTELFMRSAEKNRKGRSRRLRLSDVGL